MLFLGGRFSPACCRLVTELLPLRSAAAFLRPPVEWDKSFMGLDARAHPVQPWLCFCPWIKKPGGFPGLCCCSMATSPGRKSVACPGSEPPSPGWVGWASEGRDSERLVSKLWEQNQGSSWAPWPGFSVGSFPGSLLPSGNCGSGVDALTVPYLSPRRSLGFIGLGSSCSCCEDIVWM